MARINDAALIRALADFGQKEGASMRLVDAARRLAERLEGRPRSDADLAARRRSKRRWTPVAVALAVMVGVAGQGHAETFAGRQCRLFRAEHPHVTAPLNVACIRPDITRWFNCPQVGGGRPQLARDAIYFASSASECQNLNAKVGG